MLCKTFTLTYGNLSTFI